MSLPWIVTGAQIDVRRGDLAANRAKMVDLAGSAAAAGSRLVVFPEAALSGYCYNSRVEGLAAAETVSGPTTDALAAVCRDQGIHVVFGLLEREGDRLFNSAALVGPAGLVGCYRKTHLPFLGIDRFVDKGDRPYEVFDLGGLKIGMLICYDGSFPESCRVLSLLGADLIVLPTNYPVGAECSCEHVAPMRAHENHIYFLAVNRVGEEAGFRFIGRSRLVEWRGKVMAAPEPPEGEALFSAEISPAAARAKRVVNIPGEYELDRLADRRVDLYGLVMTPPARVGS